MERQLFWQQAQTYQSKVELEKAKKAELDFKLQLERQFYVQARDAHKNYIKQIELTPKSVIDAFEKNAGKLWSQGKKDGKRYRNAFQRGIDEAGGVNVPVNSKSGSQIVRSIQAYERVNGKAWRR